MICMKPRLKRRYGRLVYPEGLTVKALVQQKKQFLQEIKFGSPEDDHVEYVEDCFADMERPKFGWRVKVTVMQDEPCDLNPENPELKTCTLPLKVNNETDSGLNINNAQRRQTLEQFRSAAPLDCRITYVCDENNQVDANILNNNENQLPPTLSPTLSTTLSPSTSTIPSLRQSPTLSTTLSPTLSATLSPIPSLKQSSTFAPMPSPTLSPTPKPSPSTTPSPLINSHPTLKSYKDYYKNFKPILK